MTYRAAHQDSVSLSTLNARMTLPAAQVMPSATSLEGQDARILPSREFVRLLQADMPG